MLGLLGVNGLDCTIITVSHVVGSQPIGLRLALSSKDVGIFREACFTTFVGLPCRKKNFGFYPSTSKDSKFLSVVIISSLSGLGVLYLLPATFSKGRAEFGKIAVLGYHDMGMIASHTLPLRASKRPSFLSGRVRISLRGRGLGIVIR